jgi:hypothetical protein
MRKLVTPAFLVVVCLLGLAELGARLFFPHDITGRFAYGYDPQAGFAEHADGTVELYRAGGRRFHPQSFLKKRPPGTYRIFVVGDSVPRGPSFKAAYPWQLGADLREHHIRAESINLAVAGYGPRRCQIVLRKVMEFDPSLIILHVDDANKWEDEREWRRSREFLGWHPKHWPMKVFIFRRLYEAKLEKVFWTLLPEEIRLKHAQNDADAQLAAEKDPRELAARIRLAEKTTADNVALVRRLHLPILLVTQCRLEGKFPDAVHLVDHGLDGLAKKLVAPGVYCLSMKEVLSGLPAREIFANYSAHLTESGHRLLAQAICRKILENPEAMGLKGVPRAVAGGGREERPGRESLGGRARARAVSQPDN